MRITCPSCSSGFELPSELLGKKGRALKCASCGHAWYQSPVVETLDLAAVMGQDYANAAAGARPSPAMPAAPRPGQQQQSTDPGTRVIQMPDRKRGPQGAAPGRQQPPAPAVSMMRRNQPNQYQQNPQGGPPVPPGAVSM